MLMHLKIEGGEELARKLNALGTIEKRTVAAALKSGAEPIRGMTAANMKRSAQPHQARPAKSGAGGMRGRHGAMGASHAADHVVVTLGKSGHSIAIGPAAPWWYWGFQELEFGTTRRRAQPALRPAFDTHGPTASGIITRQLWEAVKGTAEGGSSSGGRFL